MSRSDIIIVGAGATGLMAGRILAKAGKKVTVLEARDRIGGRIYTINESVKIELGAEFIHGDLPVTLALLKEAGIPYEPAGGEMWRYKDGEFLQDDEPTEGWDELIDKLKELDKDTDLDSFLEQYFFGEKYDQLKASVRKYVAGYDTADPDKASAFALREEWTNEDEDAQHRLTEGYCQMIDYLANEIKSNDGTIELNTVVKSINWLAGEVTVYAENNIEYKAEKVLIALPLGVLQLRDGKGAIDFNPAIPVWQDALQQIGFGAIIKTLFQFNEAFWEYATGADMTNMGFVFAEEQIPTWWTQAPKQDNVLTGWLGGPNARDLVNVSEEEILEIALTGLSYIYDLSVDQLKEKLLNHHIMNWTADTFTLGSYAYDMVGSKEARKVLNRPISNTIFLAGEYLYDGAAMGTVEAALTSATAAAKQLIS